METKIHKMSSVNMDCVILLTLPRLTFSTNMVCLLNTIGHAGFKVVTSEGVYWGAALTAGIDTVVKNYNPEYILFVDYDSAFNYGHIMDLFRASLENPDADFIVPVQLARHHNRPISFRDNIDYSQKYTAIREGHFGLTLAKTAAFAAIPKPWFLSIPNQDGEWGPGSVDADIFFWDQAAKGGKKVISANNICIGHMDLMVKWPKGDNAVMLQPAREFGMHGQPPDVHFRYVEPATTIPTVTEVAVTPPSQT